MSTHKTPYEIRLNLLELAQKIESERMAAESVESGSDKIDRAPSVHDVINAAEELNKFVSKPNS